jgi:hypothetical protein
MNFQCAIPSLTGMRYIVACTGFLTVVALLVHHP